MEYQTINEILECISRDGVDSWVHDFLNTSGVNTGLSDGLKKDKRYWFGPTKISLDLLTRCCGYEEEMEFKESKEVWYERIEKNKQLISDGMEMAPLIVTMKDDTFSIRDGNHRYEALKQLNVESYWTLIWCDSKDELAKIKERI